jgi:hypothetical protein
MRTTVEIPDPLFQRAKSGAAERGPASLREDFDAVAGVERRTF